jgi:gluconolactonase
VDFEVLASGLGFTEGPVALADGDVVVTSVTEGALFRLAPDGSVRARIETGGGPNGLAVDAAGVLYVAQNGGIWGGRPGCPAGVQRVEGDSVAHVVTAPMEAPNDLCFGPDGRLYVTDPRGETMPHEPETALPGRLWSCRPDGSDLQLLVEGPRFINGLAFDAAGTTLYVIESSVPHRVLRADWSPAGLGALDELHVLAAGFPDGMALDADGNLWIATTGDHSVIVVSPEGRQLARFPCGDGSVPTNCCFGGPGRDVLYVSASGLGAVLRASTDAVGLPLRG